MINPPLAQLNRQQRRAAQKQRLKALEIENRELRAKLLELGAVAEKALRQLQQYAEARKKPNQIDDGDTRIESRDESGQVRELLNSEQDRSDYNVD